MTTDNNISTIKRLLDSYYEATISGLEMQELLRLLSETEDLPGDLLSDRDMLLALHSMPRHDAAREKSRESLSRTLASLPTQCRRHYRRWSVALGASLAAACFACILVIGFGSRNPAPTTPLTTTPRLTASTCDTIPERIIRLATDTLDIVASAPKIVSSKVRARSHAAIASVRTDAVKECIADTTRLAEVLRRQQAEDAETLQLLADILTTVQDDYATTMELMDDINASYSSAVAIPTKMKVKFENKPLPTI